MWGVAHERGKYEKIFLSSLLWLFFLGHRPVFLAGFSSPWPSQRSPQAPFLDHFSWPLFSLIALNTNLALMSLTFISIAWTAPLNLTPISNCLLLISTWMSSGHLKFHMSQREMMFSHRPAPLRPFFIFQMVVLSLQLLRPETLEGSSTLLFHTHVQCVNTDHCLKIHT